MHPLLSEDDHNKLDAFLGKVLEDYSSGRVNRTDAIGAIAHCFAALDKGNIGEVRSTLKNYSRAPRDTG